MSEKRTKQRQDDKPKARRPSDQDIEGAHHAQTQNHGAPEADIIEDALAADPGGSLEHDDGELGHLGEEAVATHFLGDAGHDEFVADGGDEESDEGGGGAGEVGAGGAVDVAAEEVVDGDVPLAGELEPVDAVPPVGVELAVGEAGDFREGAQDVFEDDEEDEEEGNHEGEEDHADAFGEDERPFGQRVHVFEPQGGFRHNGQDELF